jgi:phage-related protein
MAALVEKLASSNIAQNVVAKLASSDLGQSIIDKVAPNADALDGSGVDQPGSTEFKKAMEINTKIEEGIEKGIEKVVELKDKFDSKLGNYYWTLRIVLVLVVVTIISIIIYKYKLPLICYGCESPTGFSQYIFKCVNDTSQDSDLCKMSKAIDSGTEGISREFDKITIISRSVFKELSKDIPDTIKTALTNIIDQISGLISDLIADIQNLAKNFTTFLNNTFSSIQNMYIRTRDELYNIILKPIIDFISGSIITPISTIITQLMSFKDIVSNAISGTISKVTGVFTDLKNEIIKPLKDMPKSLEAFINQIIRFLNDFAKGGAKITRDSIGTIVDGLNDAINKIIGFLNDFAKGGAKITRDSINTVVDKISEAVNTTIGGINDVTKKATGVTRTAVHGAIDGIEIGVNTTLSGTVNGIETGVNTIVGGINTAITGATGVTRTAVNGAIDGIETGVNTTLSGTINGIETGVNTIVGGINSAITGATGVTRQAVNGAIDGIETGVNTTLSGTINGIETGVNTIVGGINSAITGATGVTRQAVHGTIDGIETGVNTIVRGINDGTSKISSGITTAVNPIVSAVNTVVGGVNDVLNVSVPAVEIPQIDFPGMNFGQLGSTPKAKIIDKTTLIPSWKPFERVNKASTISFSGVNIPTVNNLSIAKPTINNPTAIANLSIPGKPANNKYLSITKPTINDPAAIANLSIPGKPSIRDSRGNLQYLSITKPTINDPAAIANLSIPGKPSNRDSRGNLQYLSITKPTINDPAAIGNITIPKPTIDDPNVIANISIPKPTINDPNVIPDVSLDKVSEDINKGLGDAYEKATGGIRKVYNDAMNPINDAITTLVGLAATLSASINIFFEKYLNMEFLTNALKQIQEKVYNTVGEIINVIKTNVFDPVYNIILQITDKIVGVINSVIGKLKEIVLIILEKVNTLFNTLSDTLYATGTFIVKNIFYVSFYSFTNLIDKIIPLPVQKTVKVNFVLVTIAYILFLYSTSQVRSVVKEALAQYYILFLLLLSFLALYFLFPKKEEITKMTSDAQQIASTTVLPAISNTITQKETYQNIEMYKNIQPSNMTRKETYQNIEMYKNIEPYSDEHKNQFSKITF